MPYFGDTFGGKLKEQVGLKKNGNDMTAAGVPARHRGEGRRRGGAARAQPQAPDAAHGRPRPSSSTRAAGARVPYRASSTPSPSVPFGDGPPCLEQLARDEGARAASRTTRFSTWASTPRCAIQTAGQEQARAPWQDHLDPPGRAEATATLIKSTGEEGLLLHLQDRADVTATATRASARCRPFGVGEAGDVPRPERHDACWRPTRRCGS
jgi:hypothetical protein